MVIRTTLNLRIWVYTECCVKCTVSYLLLVWCKTVFIVPYNSPYQYACSFSFAFLNPMPKCPTPPWNQGQQNVFRHSMTGSPPALQVCVTSLWLNLSAARQERLVTFPSSLSLLFILSYSVHLFLTSSCRFSWRLPRLLVWSVIIEGQWWP